MTNPKRPEYGPLSDNAKLVGWGGTCHPDEFPEITSFEITSMLDENESLKLKLATVQAQLDEAVFALKAIAIELPLSINTTECESAMMECAKRVLAKISSLRGEGDK